MLRIGLIPAFKLWLIVGAFLALLAVGLASATTVGASVSDQAEVVDLVNAERAAHGLRPVAANRLLTAAAQDYAVYMADANFFSHRGEDGSTLVSRAEASGYTAWAFLGENLAGGQPTAERVVAAWMKSPGHRANVLSPEALEVGVGHAFDASSTYRHYWAMEMGAGW